MVFICIEPLECILSMVREFNTNLLLDAQMHFMNVRGIEVNLFPLAIN